MNKKQCIGLCALLLTSAIAYADVSGTVYKDIPFNGTSNNTYGIKDDNEKGVADINVSAGGKSTLTDANGNWSITTNDDKVKVEFTNIPAHLKESAGQSSVQFIDGSDDSVNLALFDPSEYAVSLKNDIAMTLQSTKGDGFSLIKLNNDEVPNKDNSTLPTDNNKKIPIEKTGSVWGLAYDNTNKILYTSAVVRRHVAMGPEGPNAIYKINSEGEAELFKVVDDNKTITSNEDRNLDSPKNHDPIFDEVGRVGLGDIDISSDGTKLYTINIDKNMLVEINIKDKKQKFYNIGNPFKDENCSKKDVKSWGIGQNNGKVYVGSVCTTDTEQGAYISELNRNDNNFTAFHHIPLNMKGENSLDSHSKSKTGNTLPDFARWGKWIINPKDLFDGDGTRSSLPAPILSDIVFDENDSMIIGFADRTALQAGTDNLSPIEDDRKTYKYDSAGDIYKVCKVNGIYVNEGGEGCKQNDIKIAEKNETIFPEFFTEEEWRSNAYHNSRHKEIALGGLAYLQGSQSLLSSAFDPTDIKEEGRMYNISGIIWMNTTDGTKQAGKRIVGGQYDVSYNGKAGGVGDIEILTPAAPTEIGNRVWFDEDANCIQDANESGIAGVEVSLYANATCKGEAIKKVDTDDNGRYLFSVDAGKTYSVCINGVKDINNSESPLDKKVLTCSDKGTSINNNDATLAGDDAKITIAPLTSGANDHSLDFGFTAATAEIGNRVWFDEDANCIQDANESGIAGVNMSLYSSSDCTGTADANTSTDDMGYYAFDVDAGKTYSVCINDVASQTVLKDKNLTTTSCTNVDPLINSDARLVNGSAIIAIAPLTTGVIDRSFDFGFTAVEAPTQPPVVTPTPVPVVVPTPEPVVVVEQNRSIDHTDGSCDCHSYTEDSSPALNVWSIMILISLTSLMAFLFRKEIDQTVK